jgi:hypothetical protein
VSSAGLHEPLITSIEIVSSSNSARLFLWWWLCCEIEIYSEILELFVCAPPKSDVAVSALWASVHHAISVCLWDLYSTCTFVHAHITLVPYPV